MRFKETDINDNDHFNSKSSKITEKTSHFHYKNVNKILGDILYFTGDFFLILRNYIIFINFYGTVSSR